MRQRWMRLSNSRKLWISTRRNYCQTEVLTFYVTENLPPTMAWQPARRVSARHVGAIERGDVSASITVLGQIAEALGVEPGELLRRSS
jgi:hypothetical protein